MVFVKNTPKIYKMPLLEALVSVIAPHNCLICFSEGDVLCSTCLELEIIPVPSRCYICMKATGEFAVCSSCRHKTSLKRVWVRTAYDDVSSKPILALKFERARAAHKPLAWALANTLPVLPRDVLVVGVPTATSRIRERGYDHIKLTVKALAGKAGLVWSSPLVRMGQAHQFGASRADRLRQLKDAFYVVSPQEVVGKHILLVDDVLTTGATLEIVAKTLKAAGAKQIDAIVFAQKV